jgi:hypothetical protein
MRGLGGKDGMDLIHIRAVEGAVQGADKVMAQVGHDTAQSVGDAGAGGDEDFGHGQLAGQRHGMQGARAAKGKQGKVARISAHRDGHHADCARHMGVGDADDSLGRLFDRKAQRRGDLVLHGLTRKVCRRAKAVRGQAAQQQVGVRNSD